MPAARQLATQRKSQATTAADVGGQNDSKASKARTKANTANILATVCRDWRPGVTTLASIPPQLVSLRTTWATALRIAEEAPRSRPPNTWDKLRSSVRARLRQLHLLAGRHRAPPTSVVLARRRPLRLSA